MSKTITVYTLAELRDQFPDAYAKVHERWQKWVASSSDIPWSEETMDSLRAVIGACGGTLRDWSIGAYSQCSIEVGGIDDDEQNREWFLHNVLKPNGYTQANGRAHFPGLCKFTGYCADDDFLEATWKALCDGDTLTEALASLAGRAGELMEADLEQHQEEDSMLANWEDALFTEDGAEV